MAAPSFVAASTGATDAGGNWSATGAAGTSGNIVIVQILQDGTTDSAVTFTSASNIEDLAGTDNAWTQISPSNNYGGSGSANIGSPTRTGQQFLFIGRLINTSAPTIGGGNSTSEDLYWRFYEFQNVSTGTTLATVIENSTAGNATNGVGTSTTVSDTAVTTLGPDRLALNFVGLSDDAMGLAAFAGETGGDWTLPVAIYEESSGTDATIALMAAQPEYVAGDNSTAGAGAAQINGGSGSVEKAATSFTLASTASAVTVSLVIDKTNSPVDNLLVSIQADSGGLPSGTDLCTGSLACSSLTGSPVLRPIAMTYALLSAGTYWIVVGRSGARDTVNAPRWYAASVDSGSAKKLDSGTWNTMIGTRAFKVTTNNATTIDGGSDSITNIGWGVVGFALIGTTVAYEQTHFRYRNDDGNETTATWMAALDTNP